MLIVLHGMFSLKNKKQKRAVFALAVLLFSSGIFLLTTSGVHAAEDYGYFGNAFMAVFKSLLYGIFVMVGWFASMAITLFEWAILPENVSGNSGLLNRNSIYSMWKMIRDFFNLFFILTLLYTAFTIVFQVAKNYKQTLLSIILAAMFVNFSFPITRVIIDMTNVPMYYFVNQLGSNGSSQKDYLGTVLSATKLQDILVPGSKGGISNVNFSNIGVSQLLMAIVFLFIFSVTLLVLAVMFVVRLAALIILLIFSSVGFAASVIPGLEKYGSMWWEKLAQYALFGPAAMLMLVIATQFFAEISQDNTNAQFVQAGLANSTPETAGFISSMAMFTVPIVMLWAAIGLAVSSSLVGAGAVVGLGYAAIKGAGKLVTRSPASYIGRKIDSRILAPRGLSPTAWKMAFTQRSEEQKHKDEQPIKQAAGKQQDQLNQVISRFTSPIKSYKAGRGIDHTDHEFAEMQKQASEYKKEISDTSTQSDYVMNELKSAIATKNKAKADAAMQILAKGNDLNDLIISMGKDYGAEVVDGNVQVSTQSALNVVEGILKASGETNPEMIAKKAMIISDASTDSGNFAFGGLTQFNADKHRFEMQTSEGHANWAGGKVKNLETQKRQTTMHPDSLFKRYVDSDGKGHFGDINGDTAKAIISTFTNGDVAEVRRSRDDMKQAIYDAYQNLGKESHKGFTEMYNNNQIFKAYVNDVVKLKEPKKEEKSTETPEEKQEKARIAELNRLKEKRREKTQ